MEIVGTRAVLLIMREAFFGTRRFDDFAKRVGIGEPAAAARLKELTAAGLLERVPYREPGQRTRHAYQLTAKGRDFLPVLVALRRWGDAWAAGEQGPRSFCATRNAVPRCMPCSGATRDTTCGSGTRSSTPARVSSVSARTATEAEDGRGSRL
ncbi:winged helix-turn-helix transcriptional regulator [Streptomyces sp. AF1A]|uniref:winged helix-turn-helix transcriptional regulator n=1 Tax=Streptomyces sp. AF1A TaxID=3394350 RepID=UPI0039BCC9F0